MHYNHCHRATVHLQLNRLLLLLLLLSSLSSSSSSSSLSPLCRVALHIFPETKHVPRGYIVAAILSLLFMVPLCLVPVLVLLFFYVSTFRRNVYVCMYVCMYVLLLLLLLLLFALRIKWKVWAWIGLIWLRIGTFDRHL